MARVVAFVLTLTLCAAAAFVAGVRYGAGRAESMPPPAGRVEAPPAPIHGPAWHGPQAADPERTTAFGSDWLPLEPFLVADPLAPLSQRDLYGNEIAPAVATYTSDRAGGMYEEHSPHTEVASLGAPTT